MAEFNQVLQASAEVNSGEMLTRLLEGLNLPELPEKEIDPNSPRYIMHSTPIDKHTVKRTRILVTPGVCTKCGFDAVGLAYKQNKIPTSLFSELSPEIQEIMKQVVIRHKIVAHTEAEELIITEKPREWLSGRELGR